MFTKEQIDRAKMRVGCGTKIALPAWYEKSLEYYLSERYRYENGEVIEVGAEPPHRGRKKKNR